MSNITSTQQLCGFVGNSDTYGLGVRLGAYLQWITSLFASQLSASEADSMRGVNTCFNIAMLVALIWQTFSRDPHLYPSEAYILLLFCICGICSTFLFSRNLELSTGKTLAHDLSVMSSFFSKFLATDAGGLVTVAFTFATFTYMAWFSFKGLDDMDNPPCASRVFFFAIVDLHGWLRKFLQVLSISTVVGSGLAFLVSLLQVGWNSRMWLVHWMEADPSDNQDRSHVTTVTLSLKNIGIALAVFFVFTLAIELTLIWSHIRDVYSCSSTGQLFPLVIGISGLLRLSFVLGKNYVKGSLRAIWAKISNI
ncbi:hypothetical protein N7451_010684 [Penicillium sp. IBT 35674x]|nr:hypothetical protein N7451_010684 [Penicillium sp. IBT 35674x]